MLAGWIVSLTTIFLIIYGNDPDINNHGKSDYLAYWTLFRTCWAIALGWIIYASAKVSLIILIIK